MSRRKFAQKILAPAALKRKLARSPGSRPLVFTNGCFDLLHPGHVSYLERARALGAALVVALNSDDSVRGLKGPTRPVNCLEDRLQVIAALESVDFVTWFGESTPLELIELLRPDRLVKGGDWTPDQIVGSKEVLDWGGKVRSLPFVKGKSTTRIIERLTMKAAVKRLGRQ